MPQLLDCVRDGLGFLQTLAVGMGEDVEQIRPADLSRDPDQPAANPAEHAPGGLPCPDTIRQIAFDGFANGHAGVPRAQHGQFVGIGKAGRIRGGGIHGLARLHER